MCRSLHIDSVYLHLYLWHSNNAHSIYVVPLSPTVVEAAVVLKNAFIYGHLLDLSPCVHRSTFFLFLCCVYRVFPSCVYPGGQC